MPLRQNLVQIGTPKHKKVVLKEWYKPNGGKDLTVNSEEPIGTTALDSVVEKI
jgi:hypothetical protein